jgi:hypothetical protein
LASSNPMHLDLKVTSDFTRMRGRDGGGYKLGGALAFLSGNGSKWRPLGREAALYNWDQALQRAAGPRGLSGANFGDPMVWHLQRIFCPTALFGLTATW